jgi:predicted ATPase/DNA-binding CsgD family transcriptional regulator/transcriptional regulator with XRE-family HTH domain
MGERMDATAGEPSRFGERLRALREAAGLTQEELAERAGLTAGGEGALERGDRRRPYSHTVRALATALGLSEAAGAEFIRSTRKPGGAALPPTAVGTTLALPIPVTSLVGRAREIAEIGGLLGRDGLRLLTLTGPGGVGKTRLAIEVGAQLAGDFPDGVAFVPLAPLVDPALVVPAIAQALGVRETAGRPLHEALRAYLGDRQMLVVLDNFEHLLTAASAVASFLTAGPHSTLLVTSRAPLHLSGEQEYPVAPLALPAASSETAAALGTSPAVALFVERAGAADPSFTLTDRNAAAVAELCRRLDGLPLAIELAAARVKLFTPHALLSRLTSRLWLLTGGARDLPDRQRTLRDAIAWSHDLLSPAEQELFRRLAVFAGGVDLEAAEAVLAGLGGASADATEALEGLAALVDGSLLRREDGVDGEPRFGMLETVREYALEQLAASGEADVVRQAHATYFLALAERADAQILGPDQVAWLDRLEAEHDNLRAALAWADVRGRDELLMRLAGELARFWRFRWHRSEGQRWLDRALARGDGKATAWWAKVLLGAGIMASMRRDYPQAAELHREALAIYRGLGDRWATARVLLHLGEAVGGLDDAVQAQAMFSESLDMFRELGEQALASLVLKNLGQLARRRGDAAAATALFEESLVMSHDAGFAWGRAETLLLLAGVTRDQGNRVRATEFLAEALTLYGQQGDKEGMALAVDALAAIVGERGWPERAARLFGVAAALHESAEVGPFTSRGNGERGEEAIRSSLGGPAFADAVAAGRTLAAGQVGTGVAALVAELAAVPAPLSAPAPTGLPAGLTEREADVLRLVALGLTNHEVADRLFLSRRTVDTHLHRVYEKLGVSGRAAATRFAVEHKLA